ncbi:hypothetical protein LCGC14_2456610 [marine sediment metagenome]|uniref:Uncharacterized protein n=1 Tax=marine sediment metagenome TaxID=412755 RepID=A0A0F9C263_9ZZZZ
MRVLKENSKAAEKIREVEQFLREKGISISHRSDGLIVSVDDKDYVILDGESRDINKDFPTCVEPSRIQTIEDYINCK